MRAEIWVGPERRRRWSVDEKLRIVREAFAPEARVADVARRRDVSRAQIYQWRAELGDGRLGDGRLTAAGTEVVGFVPVELSLEGTASAGFEQPAPIAASAPVIEIGLAGGRSLKVPSSCRPRTCAG